MDLEHEKRLTSVEERAKSNSHRLDKLEPIIEEIHNMSAALVEMTAELKHTNQSVEEIKDKVEDIEKEPARRWKDSTKALFNTFLGAIGTAVAGGVVYLLTNIK